MRTLQNYINDYQFESCMSEINESLICESLQSSYLQEIVDQLKEIQKIRKENDAHFLRKCSFADLFGRYAVAWDKITDDDFESYSAGDKKGITKVRGILSSSKGVAGIALLKNKDSNKFIAMICWNGKYMFNGKEYSYKDGEYVEVPNVVRETMYKQKDAAYDCENYDFLFLDITKFYTYDKKIARGNSRENMVLQGDSDYYSKIAKENVERYKKIIAKNKAEKAAQTDTIANDVKAIMDELMNLSADVVKNPDKYVETRYQIDRLIESVYSTTSYDSRRHTSYGKTGLLRLFNEYIKSHIDLHTDGGYSFQRDSHENTKKKIQDMIKEMQQRIADIKAKSIS